MGIRRRLLRTAVALSAPPLLAGCSVGLPKPPGVVDGRLADCPASYNCVSSLARDEAHRIAPLPIEGPVTAAMEKLAGIVRALPRATVRTSTGTYLHAEFRSAVFGFVDDAEFLADEAAGVIQVRSAARVGFGDFGVNRRRIEAIRARWADPAPR